MKRFVAIAAFVLFGTPILAWEFTETSVCVLTHEDPNATVVVTFDPPANRYTIAISRPGKVWAGGQNFRIQFNGEQALTIGTTRHVVSDDGLITSVSDSGFGNVLDGIQFNDTMTAALGDDTATVQLSGAADPMVAFRQCPQIATS